MFARLSIYENVDLDLADRVKQFMETLADRSVRRPARLPRLDDARRPRQRPARRHRLLRQRRSRQEADALLTTTWSEAIADQVPDTIRPALDMRPDTVGLYEIVQRD